MERVVLPIGYKSGIWTVVESPGVYLYGTNSIYYLVECPNHHRTHFLKGNIKHGLKIKCSECEWEEFKTRQFGRLKPLSCEFNSKNHNYDVTCLCSCGRVVTVSKSSLLSGRTRSCGCLNREVLAKRNEVDLIGQQFGYLEVIARDRIDENHQQHWKCLCHNCGGITTSPITVNLRSGLSKSCGCVNIQSLTSHGLSSSLLYHVWDNMLVRCYKQDSISYPNYGGKGIKVCDEWKKDVKIFYDWAISHGYREGLSLDRINPFKDYYPDNCRWVDISVQAKNKRQAYFTKFKKIFEDQITYLRTYKFISNDERNLLHSLFYELLIDEEFLINNIFKVYDWDLGLVQGIQHYEDVMGSLIKVVIFQILRDCHYTVLTYPIDIQVDFTTYNSYLDQRCKAFNAMYQKALDSFNVKFIYVDTPEYKTYTKLLNLITDQDIMQTFCNYISDPKRLISYFYEDLNNDLSNSNNLKDFSQLDLDTYSVFDLKDWDDYITHHLNKALSDSDLPLLPENSHSKYISQELQYYDESRLQREVAQNATQLVSNTKIEELSMEKAVQKFHETMHKEFSDYEDCDLIVLDEPPIMPDSDKILLDCRPDRTVEETSIDSFNKEVQDKSESESNITTHSIVEDILNGLDC